MIVPRIGLALSPLLVQKAVEEKIFKAILAAQKLKKKISNPLEKQKLNKLIQELTTLQQKLSGRNIKEINTQVEKNIEVLFDIYKAFKGSSASAPGPGQPGSTYVPPDSPKVRLMGKMIIIKQKIAFGVGTGAAVISPESDALLDEIAYVINTNPRIKKIEIGGHTDNRGNPEALMSLSQGRVDAVRNSLIRRGVEIARLEAKGYGSTKPNFLNITPAGRARNRRIEFRIIEMGPAPAPPIKILGQEQEKAQKDLADKMARRSAEERERIRKEGEDPAGRFKTQLISAVSKKVKEQMGLFFGDSDKILSQSPLIVYGTVTKGSKSFVITRVQMSQAFKKATNVKDEPLESFKDILKKTTVDLPEAAPQIISNVKIYIGPK